MGRYVPRRAGARWMEGAPDYVFDCFDEPKEGDRYTILLKPQGDGTRRGTWIPFLGIDEHAQGFWGEFEAHQAADFRYRRKHRRVAWMSLPEPIRKYVVARWNQN